MELVESPRKETQKLPEQLDAHVYEARFSDFEATAHTLIALAHHLEPLIEQASTYDRSDNPEQRVLDSEPAYLGSGSVKIAMNIESDNGDNYALKVLKERPDRPSTLDAEIAPLLKGHDIPGLEQLIAVDRESNTFVTTLALGKNIAELTPGQIVRIKKKHLQKLEQTLSAMREQHLHPHNAGGILYDKKEGFTIVDYTFDDPDSKTVVNRGSTASVDTFLDYALTDFKKIDRLQDPEQLGMRIPAEAYETTGRRGLARAIVQRRARKTVT